MKDRGNNKKYGFQLKNLNRATIVHLFNNFENVMTANICAID